MYKFQMQRIGVADDPTLLRPTLQGCIESVLDHSNALIDNILEGLTLSLGHTRGKSTVMGHNKVVRATVERLQDIAPALKITFAKELRSAVYNNDAAVYETKPEVGFEELQLFEENQIDASIEFAMAQQEVSRCVEDVLPALNGLVSNLLGWVAVQPQLNPIKPEAFVRALRETLVLHVPSEEARRTLVTPSAGLLGVSLNQLYSEVTHWLRSHGVESVGIAGRAAGIGPGQGSRSAVETATSRTLLTLDKLRRLLTTEIDLGFGDAEAGTDFNHTVPASLVALEDMKLIEPMMKRLAYRAGQHSRRSSRVNAALGLDGGGRKSAAKGSAKDADASDGFSSDPGHGKNLGKQLGDEVVHLMLENLLMDDRLLGKVRAQIAALEPVLLILTHRDARFFSDRQHPARQFLDRLTQRSLAYSSETDDGFDFFLRSISGAVAALVRSTSEAAAFERVLRQLEQGWANAEVEQRQRHEEAARSLLRAEQRNLLAHRMSESYREKLADKDVPEVVVAFLRGPWAQVVAEAELNCTDGSADADGYIALVDDLIWSVQVRLARRNRSRVVKLVPSLLIKIRQGLHLIGYPQERVPIFFDELITLHERAFEQIRSPSRKHKGAAGEPGEVMEEAPESRFAEMTPPDEFWVGELEAQESGYLADNELTPAADVQPGISATGGQGVWSVADLSIGAWVELTIDGNWVRAQLTWASPLRTLFMFVSHGGLAHSMSRRTMERLRARERIRIVSDGRLLDHALDAVAQTAMRNNLA